MTWGSDLGTLIPERRGGRGSSVTRRRTPPPEPPPAAPMTPAEISALVDDLQRALAATQRQREAPARKKPLAKQKR
jgi:hypothetical protein